MPTIGHISSVGSSRGSETFCKWVCGLVVGICIHGGQSTRTWVMMAVFDAPGGLAVGIRLDGSVCSCCGGSWVWVTKIGWGHRGWSSG